MYILMQVGYFFLIGWWAAFLWIGLALLICMTVIGFPVGIIMLKYTPVIAWLERRAPDNVQNMVVHVPPPQNAKVLPDRTSLPQAKLRNCPWCAEVIRQEAVLCRFCGSDLTEKPKRSIR